jgi:hypothetical protein
LASSNSLSRGGCIFAATAKADAMTACFCLSSSVAGRGLAPFCAATTLFAISSISSRIAAASALARLRMSSFGVASLIEKRSLAS